MTLFWWAFIWQLMAMCHWLQSMTRILWPSVIDCSQWQKFMAKPAKKCHWLWSMTKKSVIDWMYIIYGYHTACLVSCILFVSPSMPWFTINPYNHVKIFLSFPGTSKINGSNSESLWDKRGLRVLRLVSSNQKNCYRWRTCWFLGSSELNWIPGALQNSNDRGPVVRFY